ncbi:Nop56p-like protein [Ordospora colligata]|uniref:Nop56p-like protein n=1 Tax=Ordospora colligata OC4 TaxID=1354746 RepID=A0A0B2UKY9_9MICR|nr:Nop56p-like protein [Ordospora colligata OC4]KHN69929.1 Nop56p-like protein [Ordospora colligata OC4]TBU16099.1 Nop56p-like protein [Ordospora colligata]TBU16312.1 Nop56p-like protein [Ordospora colligata]TBU19016.1 Nop56p-like protein [Ordospora colligata]
MIYLLETAVGYALLDSVEGQGNAELLGVYRFKDSDEAMESSRCLIQGTVPSSLESFISSIESKKKEILGVNDQKLVEPLHKKMDRKVVYVNDDVLRSARSEAYKYFGMSISEYSERVVCIAHKICMGKIRMVPEKIDTMVIQSVNLLCDMDKDINLHCMRLKEWYGIHFPELQSVFEGNKEYLVAVIEIGRKESIDEEKMKRLEEMIGDRAERVKKLAESSMGVAMDESDMQNILDDARSVLKSFEFRDELEKYICVKMQGLAPNLMALIGDVMGAQMISKAGSLSSLAKMAGSTIQMMGAEKALFQALKAESNTPKYGIIYGSSLVGQTPSQHKAKIARSLASKIGLAARIDMYGDDTHKNHGTHMREQIMKRIKDLESRGGKSRKSVSRPKHEIKPNFYDDSKDVKKVKSK